MKPTVFPLTLLVGAAPLLDATSTSTLRGGCEYGPTPSPAPAPLEDPVVFYGSTGQEIFSWGEPPLAKCFGWGGCFRQQLASIRWQALGPPGTTIRFYPTGQCQGDEFESFPADVASGSASADASAYRTFVVVASADAEIDRSDAFGCRK